MVSVSLKNVTKRFGDIAAVEGVNLEVKDKEFLSILGPSGGGKTTLLRLIAGLEVPTEGEVYFGDKLVNGILPRDRNVSLVFQNYALFPHLTAFDNIAFPLTVRKTPKSEIDKRVKEVAELLGIRHLLDRKPKQLSGGEQQRVALGRAIVRQPDVFLMDEPLSSVDASMRIAMRTELKKLQKNLGTTLVYVTHDQTEAMTMADKIAVIRNGKLVQIDSPQTIYDSPRESWVASFIGNPPMNLIPATWLSNGQLEVSGVRPPITVKTLSKKEGLSAGKKVYVGIRPEDIEVSVAPADGAVCKGEVYLLESLGDSMIVDIKVGNSIIRAREKVDFRAQIGDQVFVRFNERRLALFDLDTGAAIS
ncbi:MAG: ABC transporter ATP-binding protein [Thaumarchaeota archaeon]|nr:ABC transporter ATP-binding protein [Nitrososphaerota archaeon]